MKKKTLVVAIVLSFVLLCSTLFSGCASENILGAKETSILDALKNEPTKLSASALAEISLEGDIEEYAGNFFYTQSGYVYTVYDFRTLSAVYTYTDVGSFDEFEFYNDADFFVLHENVAGKYVSKIIYNGSVVAEEDGYKTATLLDELFDAYGFFNFAGDLYRQTATGISLVRAQENGRTTIPSNATIHCGEKYFWVEYSNSICVAFDLALNPATEYVFPSYVEEQEIFNLAKDRILIQYLIPVDNYGDDYTLLFDGYKYDVYQAIYNTEAKSITEIDLKGIVSNVYVPEKDSEFKENRISAIASIIPIENKRLNAATVAEYNVNENGGIIEKLVTPGGFTANEVYGAVAKDKFVMYNEYVGAKQLLEKNGKVIATFKGDYNTSFYVSDKTIYDLNGKVVYEADKNDQIELLQTSAIIKKLVGEAGSGKYDVYLLVPGNSARKIAEIGDANADEIFATSLGSIYLTSIKDNDAEKAVFYNESGTELGRMSMSANMVTSYYLDNGGQVIIFKEVVNSETKYYSITIA